MTVSPPPSRTSMGRTWLRRSPLPRAILPSRGSGRRQPLKPTADRELANGINVFAIHESAEQPLLNKAPGVTLGNNGQAFNRNETWAQEAGPWVDYLARSSYLLQQGRFAADILYFYGEDSNLTAIFRTKGPDVPQGYQFDYLNADALIHMLKVGRWTNHNRERYELSGAGAGPLQRAYVVASAARYLQTGGTRRRRSGAKANRRPEPCRRPRGIQQAK